MTKHPLVGLLAVGLGLAAVAAGVWVSLRMPQGDHSQRPAIHVAAAENLATTDPGGTPNGSAPATAIPPSAAGQTSVSNIGGKPVDPPAPAPYVNDDDDDDDRDDDHDDRDDD